MSGVEALARVLLEYAIRSWHVGRTHAVTHEEAQAERILADPGPLLEALAEAGVLHRHSAPLKRVVNGGWAMVYSGDHTVEGTRYVTEWEVDDDRG